MFQPHALARLARIVIACVACASAAAIGQTLGSTNGSEAGMLSAEGFLPEWTGGPPRSSVPDWARPGKLRFTRWDGGPLETAKAMISGWPNFNPPVPDYVYVTTDWYRPETVRLLQEGNFNAVWLTFSNGFSIETERPQYEIVTRYIAECHRHGIHVFAYESVANLFWEDMFERVPESRHWVQLKKDGSPVPYSNTVPQMGRLTRYMADLANPEWQAYLRRRIDLAIAAGADGIMYDNCPPVASTYRMLMNYALSRKSDFMIMANFHNSTFVMNRMLNAFTTEEGGEAGIFTNRVLLDPANTATGANPRWKHEEATMVRIGDGYLANNIGRFRLFEDLNEGWKPTFIESRVREVGVAETNVMPPARQQLVLAENMMFDMTNETFVEDTFANGLWHRDPAALASWRAMGVYNKFQAEHEAIYVGAHSLATLAVVMDNSSGAGFHRGWSGYGVSILNALAGRNLQYHVLYEHELTPALLRPYAAVALLTADRIRDRAIDALRDYSAKGGKLFVVGSSGSEDQDGRPRSRPDWLGGRTGAGQTTYWATMPPMDGLAAAMRAADAPEPVEVEAPPTVLYNVTATENPARMMVHLVNYAPTRAGKCVVKARGRYGKVRLLTPDNREEALGPVSRTGDETAVEVSGVTIYSILVFEK